MDKFMKYIQRTIGLPLILPIEKYGNTKWYVDASFVVHKDMRINTGGFMNMGTGVAYVQPRKQILNTKSLTDAELVIADDVLAQVIRNIYFLKEKGYETHDNDIHQDNQSAIKLEKNGRWSSSKRTCHTNIICYFITDRTTKQEASIELCPTLNTISYYTKKALQGYQFKRFYNIIIVIHEDDITY